MKVITARIEDKDFEDLKVIEKEEQSDRAEVMRKLLVMSIKEWKMKKALELIEKRKITIRKAAELAGVSYVEMLDAMAKANVAIGYSLKDLHHDIGK